MQQDAIMCLIWMNSLMTGILYFIRSCTYPMFLYLKPVLLFSFQDFEIQSSHRCGLDWISIGTYKNLDGYRACGSSIPAPYISSQDHVWIKFHSDDSMTGKGFRLSYITGRPAIYIHLDTAVSERMQLRRCLTLPCDTRKFSHSQIVFGYWKMTCFPRTH